MMGRNSSTLRLTLIAGFSALLVASEVRAEQHPEIRMAQQSTGSRDDTPSAPAPGEPTVSPDEIISLMPLLVPMPEQKQLAAELRSLLEKGDVKEAAHKLTVAIEVGTLASILLDWISYPALIPALQALPDDGGQAATMPMASQPAETAPVETKALTEALDQERARAATLADELGTVKTDFLALKTSREQETASASAATGELQDALKRQEERAEAAARELAGITQELALLKAQRERDAVASASDSGTLSQSLKTQEDRADASARELATVTNELEVLRAAREHETTAASTEMTNLQRALARERTRGDDVTRELATTIDQMRVLQDTRARPRILGLERPTPGAPVDTTTELLRALPPILSTGAIAAPVDTVPAAPPAAASAPPPPVASPPVSSSPVVASPAPSLTADDRLTARADVLFRSGDVSGARLLLERAQESGNAQAIFLLAETFDPNALASIGAVGIRSDPARARELYRRALALGMTRAGARMEALK